MEGGNVYSFPRPASASAEKRFHAVVKGGHWDPVLSRDNQWTLKSAPKLFKREEENKSRKQNPGPIAARGLVPRNTRKLNPSNSASSLRPMRKKPAAKRAMRVLPSGGRNSNYPLSWRDSLSEAFEVVHGSRIRREFDQRVMRYEKDPQTRLSRSRSQGYVSIRAKVVPGEMGIQSEGLYQTAGDPLETRRSTARLPVYLENMLDPEDRPTYDTPVSPRRRASEPNFFPSPTHHTTSARQLHTAHHQPYPEAEGLMYDIDNTGTRYSPRSSTGGFGFKSNLDDPFLHLTSQECKAEKLRLKREEMRLKRQMRQQHKQGLSATAAF